MKLTSRTTVGELLGITIIAVGLRLLTCLMWGFDRADISFLVTLVGFWLMLATSILGRSR